MTPGARISAAIRVLDQIRSGSPAEQALLRWSRGSRFAGSGDRAAVRDLVFDALRQRLAFAAWGGGEDGRSLMLGRARAEGMDIDKIFTGLGYAPEPVTDVERLAGGQPDQQQRMNLPDWLMPQWVAALGTDANAVAEQMSARAPVWLRVNANRADPETAIALLAEDEIEADHVSQLPTALHVRAGERKISNSRAYQEGVVELQDLSPQLACAALPLMDGQRVLDYCAGGGGKSLAVAARARVAVEAHDADPARMADLPIRAKRAGTAIQTVSRPKGAYDLVIADVPCSGSGTWRRTPDAKWRLRPENLKALIATQRQIIDESTKFVGPDGHFAYMTCSLLADENDQQIISFQSRNKHFELVQRHLWTPLNGSDGFFLALLRRVG